MSVLHILDKYFILSNKSKIIISLSVLMLSAIWSVLFYHKKVSLKKAIISDLLCIYLFLIFASTVFMRIDWSLFNVSLSGQQISNLIPFHSYYQILCGKTPYIQEVVCNVLMLVPVGMCIPVLLEDVKITNSINVGICISSAIEILQFIYGCGSFEIDDILHNSLGCVLGSLIVNCFIKIISKTQ